MKKKFFFILFFINFITESIAMDNSKLMFTYIYSFPEQLQKAREIGTNIVPHNNLQDINGIVFAGMGGSGIAGEVVATSISKNLEIPVVCVKGYSLPNWVNNHTLVILCSYSGNTEETLSCFNDAKNRNACIVGITSGGVLRNVLVENNYDCIEIPRGMQPRAALGYLSIPLYFYLGKVGFIAASMIDLIV